MNTQPAWPDSDTRTASKAVSGDAPVACWCGSAARLTDTRAVWPNLRPVQPMWVCSRYPTCDSYVRCHEGTTEAMGSLAGQRLRKLRGLAHRMLDPLWQDGGRVVDRGMFYRIAGEVMGIPEFHIGHLDEEGCMRLIERTPLIEAALDRHAALVLHPSDLESLDPDTRGLLHALFDVDDASPSGKRLRLSHLMAYAMPVQDLHVRGVLCIDGIGSPDPVVSLSELGRRLLAPPSTAAQRQS